MSVHIHLSQLQKQAVVLEGEIPVRDLDFEITDEMIQSVEPLKYALEAQLLDKEILVGGRLALDLQCTCVRCLNPFMHPIRLEAWTCLLPISGEDRVEMCGDSIDLTPIIRDDVLLEFPQHPLCRTDCKGLSYQSDSPSKPPAESTPSSVWDELNNLKLE